MARSPRRNLLLLIASVLLVMGIMFFPRLLVFFEFAARELRYLWWLVLLVALAIWFGFFFGKKRD